MLRGCQKKIIFLRNTDSDVFEEAYFVIKDDAAVSPGAEEDMVREANRILRENIISRARPRKAVVRRGTFLPFLIGTLFSAAIFTLLYFLL